MAPPTRTAEVRTRFETVLQGIAWNGSQGTARCPFHADHRPSLSVNAELGLFYCHGCKAKGTTADFERRILGIRQNSAGKRTPKQVLKNRPQPKTYTIEFTYPYRNANKKVIFEQVRFKPKTFRLRRPDGKGDWIWNFQGVKRVLYQLPEVLEAGKVYVAEGEKDADSVAALTGCAGTTNVGGAGKWREEFSRSLADKEIIILQDGDEPGMKHALEVAESVSKFARSVKLLPPFKNAKDISEWIENGGTLKQLNKIESRTPLFNPQSVASPTSMTETNAGWRARPIRGALLVSLVEQYFLDYIVLSPGLPLVLSVWVVGSYLFDVFDSFPYLSVTSPTKRCGKTRLGELIELLCSRPQLTVNLSEAALFRLIERDRPTLIIDEAETLSNPTSERSQNLRSVLQAGFRKGAVVPRCVGKDHDVKDFSVFCPKVIIAIGALPDTLRDRSVLVLMRRRRQSEQVRRFRRRLVTDMLEGTSNLIKVWCEKHRSTVEEKYSGLDLGFLQDREADVWEPLFSILSVADPKRLGEMQEVALRLSKEKNALDVDDSLGLRLLTDIRRIFAKAKLRSLSTADLMKDLQALPENSWEDVTPVKISRILRPFGIAPRQVWTEAGRNLRGYDLEDFKQAFERYL
jgi:5S rRNA maturation endonuclease (ribonuclease M5)